VLTSASVPDDSQLLFADHVGRFYARQYGFPPMAGRLLGYLFVCDPPQQTIDELGEALLASRSAITGAVKLLESHGMARRARTAGERMDRVGLNPASRQPQNFDAGLHKEHAALFREGLALLTDAPPERRGPLEEMVALAEFLAERLPRLVEKWHTHRDELRARGSCAARAHSHTRPGPTGPGRNHGEVALMSEPDLTDLRDRAERGDSTAVDELIEHAIERGDLTELRRIAQSGNPTATDELIQLAAEQGNLEELRRLSDAGNATAADQLIELATEQGDMDELRRLADRGNTTAAEQLLELTTE